MRRFLLCVLVLAASGLARGAGQGEGDQRYYGRWRSLAYQLPGAHRFLDRLNLTEGQQKALDRVSREWLAKRRESYTAALKDLPPLAQADRKDPEKVQAYYAKRSQALKDAQVPPPVELVNDILVEEQLHKLAEADQVIAAWNTWLEAHLGKSDKELDALLGPPSESESAAMPYTYRRLSALVDGSELFDRLNLSDEQRGRLETLGKQYYADRTQLYAPLRLTYPVGAGTVASYAQRRVVSRVISRKANEDTRNTYRQRLLEVLTPPQRKLLDEARAVVKQRDDAIWERYSRYVIELSAILPPPARPTGGAARNPGGAKK